MAESRFNPEEISARIESLVSEILRLARLDVSFQVQRTTGLYDRPFENPDLVVSFDGRDADLLLENKADLLKALEHVVLEAVGVPLDQREGVLFDCHDYRMMRVDELQLAAQAAAERVQRTGVAYQFNPMSSRERRVIHMALRGESGVRTQSEGVGLYRKVVIHPTQTAPPQQSKGHRPSR